jgi:hypothetical protein
MRRTRAGREKAFLQFSFFGQLFSIAYWNLVPKDWHTYVIDDGTYRKIDFKAIARDERAKGAKQCFGDFAFSQITFDRLEIENLNNVLFLDTAQNSTPEYVIKTEKSFNKNELVAPN